MPPLSDREAKAAGADEILMVDGAGVLRPVELGRRRNPAEMRDYGWPADVAKPPVKKGKGKKWQFEEALSLYDGHEGLLVRTALIRSPSYRPDDSPSITGGQDVARLLGHLKYADQEHMVTISMNSALRVIAIHESSIGKTNSTSFDVRDIVKTVFLSGGTRAIVAHNHPSGNPKPSEDDVRATERIKAALDCIGIELLDHIIIAQEGITSFYAEGLL